jgi:tetratricopeptide (TPR) repeat protein
VGWPIVEASVKKALEIDETIAEARGILGNIHYLRFHDWQAAELQFRQSLEYNSGIANVHFYYANYLSYMGRHKGALAEINSAIELDPLSSRNLACAAWFHAYARKFDDALNYAKELFNLHPSDPVNYLTLGIIYNYKAMYTEAIQALQTAMEFWNEPYPAPHLACAYALSGQTEKAHELLNTFKSNDTFFVEIAQVYAAFGDKSRAFEYLDKALLENHANLISLNVDPYWDSIRSDKRFTELVNKIGFE